MPFDLVTKLAVKFLGKNKLSLTLVNHCGKIANRKIYVWTVYYNTEGHVVDNPFYKQSDPDEYNGIKFNKINPNNITFF